MYHLSDDTEKRLKLKHMYHCTLNLFSFKAYTPSLPRNDVELKLHFASPPAPFFHIAVFSLCHHLRRDLRKHQARGEARWKGVLHGGRRASEWGRGKEETHLLFCRSRKKWRECEITLDERFWNVLLSFYLRKSGKSCLHLAWRHLVTQGCGGKGKAFIHERALKKHHFFK